GSGYSRLALMIGAVVCIAISNAGTCSQDLKTGFLLGSTPVKQQAALLVGVLTSVLAVGWTAYLLNLSETTEQRVAQPFGVSAEVVDKAPRVHRATADADEVTGESVADPKEYAFVRLTGDDVPKGVAEGIYLVDPDAHTAQFLREDGIGAGRL